MDWLTARGIEYRFRDIKKENPGYKELSLWYRQSGLPLKRFWNTSGIPYREQKLKDRLSAMSEEEQLRLLATDGMLVKRPLVVTESFILTGFREAEWADRINQ